MKLHLTLNAALQMKSGNCLKDQRNRFLKSSVKYFLLFSFFNLLFNSATFAFTGNEIRIDQKARAIVAPNAAKYQWYYNGQKIENSKSQALNVSRSGKYKVETTDEYGHVTTYEITIAVSATGIKKVHIIGDSTVMTYSASWYPWGGWGAFLPYFFNTTLNLEGESLQFQNHAVGGRSSKSFYDEGKWAQVLAVLLPGDIYMIQFGHNDRDWTKPERYADTTTYKEYLKKYINEGRLKGANPILVTPMNMNTWFCDVMRNVFREGANNYRGAMINLGKEMNVPVIDLEYKSDSLFEKLGRDYTTHYLFNNLQPGEYPNYPNGYSDFTHFQEMGAIEMAKLVLEGLKEKSTDPVISTLLSFLVPEYKVTVTSKTPTGGLVTRSNTFPKGLTVTLKGIANPTHQFDSWTDENGAIVTNNKMFSFVMDTVDRSFTVSFKAADTLTLQAGTYRVYNAGSMDKTKQLLEVFNNSASNGAAIMQNPGSGKTNQQWNIKHVGNGYYTFIAVNSGKSMDVSGSSLADGAKVIQYTVNTDANNQKFKLVKVSGNTYRLIAKHSGKYLQFASGTCGANLIQAAYNPDNINQQFVLELVKLNQPAIARASNPSPADGTPVVSPENIQLKWTGDAQTYNIYLGTNPDSLLLKDTGLTQTSLQLDSISALGKYFWRIDAIRDGQTEIGNTWSYTVKDTVPPVAIARDIAVTLNGGVAIITAQEVDGGSKDAYGIAKMELNKDQFDCSNLGLNEVILIVTDSNGNVSSDTAVITVNGTIPTPGVTVTKTDNTYTGGDDHTIYLGYGAQSVTLTAFNTGSAIGATTYKWNSSQVSNDTIANPVFTQSSAGTFSPSVIATNEYGCTATASTTINVIDARCGNEPGKVVVCHYGQGICIGTNDVQTHLSHGCSLANCGNSNTASISRNGRETMEMTSVETTLEAYPNPLASQTRIKTSIAEKGNYKVELFNMQGALIKTIATGNTGGNAVFTYDLDAARYAKGVYLIKLSTEKQIITKRIVIQR